MPSSKKRAVESSSSSSSSSSEDAEFISDEVTTASREEDKGEEKCYPIQVRVEKLCYRVPKPKKKKTKSGVKSEPSDGAELAEAGVPKEDDMYLNILNDINGTVEPGEMLCILGSSGAGKSSLLNLLANRVSDGEIGGNVLFNGTPVLEARHLVARSTYIMQDDLMMGSQTPREVLRFSARLRLPKGTSDDVAERRVDEVLRELNLVECADTQIGSTGAARGISGGERKRTAIGVELVTNPSLLLLDEPTSGLDSTTALRVTETLKSLAERGRTIIATVHQPSSYIFQKFDKILLLAKGEVVYFGPRDAVIRYFSDIGHPVPPNSNPADHLLYVSWVDETRAEALQEVRHMSKLYRKSEFKLEHSNYEKVLEDAKVAKQFQVSLEAKIERVGYAKQTKELLARHFRDFFRDPMLLRAPLSQTIFMASLIGFIYFQVKNGQSTAQDRLGSLFFILINQTMQGAFGTVTSFGAQKALFLREHGNTMYHATSYYLARTMGDLPFLLIQTFIFSTISFWLIGFPTYGENPGYMYIMFLFLMVLMLNVAAALGWFLSILAPNPQVAMAITPVTMIPLMMFSGFYVNAENIPDYFVWVEAISPMRYSFESLAVICLSSINFTCTDEERIPRGCAFLPGNANRTLEPDDSLCQCALTSGDQVVKAFNFKEENVWWNILVLAGMTVFLRMICHWALLWVAERSRSNA